MPISRREFIMKSSAAGISMALWSDALSAELEYLKHYKEKVGDTASLVSDEKFWSAVRNLFEPVKDFINLENGYFLAHPISTRNFFQQRTMYINSRSSWYMRKEQEASREKTREKLAQLVGCDKEELALVRNTTEAMNIVIMGYPWQKGDEVVISDQDYGSMMDQLEQAANRYGIVIRKIALPMHPQSDDQIIAAFTSAMNPKTKMLLLTHMINLTGQILPAKEIIATAHQRGVEVLVDAAHSFAQILWTFEDLDADYLGTSLHKWLCNTLGAGMFCVKKKHISKIWPLFGDVSLKADDVKKFEHFGTVQCAVYETIDKAIDFHLMLGLQLKEARLRYMKDYWTQKVFDMQKVSINTPLEARRSCAIANFKIEGLTPNELADKLYKDFKIFTVAIDHPIVKGVRVTPHLYTSIQDLDALAAAIEKIVSG